MTLVDTQSVCCIRSMQFGMKIQTQVDVASLSHKDRDWFGKSHQVFKINIIILDHSLILYY